MGGISEAVAWAIARGVMITMLIIVIPPMFVLGFVIWLLV